MQWRASAIAQSGFKLEGSSVFQKYYKAVCTPPFRGVFATIAGMSWARAFIFYGSEAGCKLLKERHVPASLSSTIAATCTATLVQFVNMPLVR